MFKKRLLALIISIMSLVILVACKNNDSEDNIIDSRQDIITEANHETTEKQTVAESTTADEEGNYIDIPAKPWRIYYPSDVPNEIYKNGSKLFTYDVGNYMVMCQCELTDGSEESNLLYMMRMAYAPYSGYSWCDIDLSAELEDVTGEYVDINGMKVYKFTVEVPTEDTTPTWYCEVYGYTWVSIVPDTDSSYRDVGKQCQYIIFGVVTSENQEAYKTEMEELTDYLMYNTQMLD